MTNGQLAQVGGTPLIRLKALLKPADGTVLAKCEFHNPTGTPKDRLYQYMIAQLAAIGTIRPGVTTLVDASTGNGGGALARAAALTGYDAVIVMPEGMTRERKDLIASWGATLFESPSQEFLLGAEKMARAYVDSHPGSYYLNQSASPLNREAMRAIGREIAAECMARGVIADTFVCSLGTGGTFSGAAIELKQVFPNIRTVAIEVDRSAPLFAKRKGLSFIHRSHSLMGLGPGKIAANVDESLIDECVTVSGEEAWRMMKRLVAEEGLETGPTSGANVLTAVEAARALGSKGTVVTILFDAAWKYRSIWDSEGYEMYCDEAGEAMSGRETRR